MFVRSYRGKGKFDPSCLSVYTNKRDWFWLSVLKLLSYRTGMNLLCMKMGMTFSASSLSNKTWHFLISRYVHFYMVLPIWPWQIIDSACGKFFKINGEIRD